MRWVYKIDGAKLVKLTKSNNVVYVFDSQWIAIGFKP